MHINVDKTSLLSTQKSLIVKGHSALRNLLDKQIASSRLSMNHVVYGGEGRGGRLGNTKDRREVAACNQSSLVRRGRQIVATHLVH